jgi:ribosomal protein L7/L12
VHFLHNWLHENQWFPEWEAYGMDQEEEEELEAEAITLLQHGRKFEAIQLVRSYTNCGVNEAKEYIRALESEV